MICKKCKTSNPDNAKYCRKCGNDLRYQPPPPPPPPPPDTSDVDWDKIGKIALKVILTIGLFAAVAWAESEGIKWVKIAAVPAGLAIWNGW